MTWNNEEEIQNKIIYISDYS